MKYKYFGERNYEDLACGRVIYHRSGYPSFPARLAGEVFMQCLEASGKERAVLYDPCCGGGYLLTVLGFLCGKHIRSIFASDISTEATALAKENLSLLTARGLARRKAHLEEMRDAFQKESHAEAIKSAERLWERIDQTRPPIDCAVFEADILDAHALLQKNFKADIVFTDVPYGNLTAWSEDIPFAIHALLNTLSPVLSDGAVVAIGSDKGQKITNPKFKRIRKILVGKRKIEIMRKAER